MNEEPLSTVDLLKMDTRQLFLQLIRAGIGQSEPNLDGLAQPIDWLALQDLAEKQGLSAIVLDGINQLKVKNEKLKDDFIPKLDLLQWIGETLQSESVYEKQWETACEMSQVFEKSTVRTYILKGFVVSECYPKPEHRLSVDLDCFLTETVQGLKSLSGSSSHEHFDAWELGNQLMEREGYKVERSFYKNSTIYLPGLTVENHQFMTAVRGNKRLKNFERLLQSMMCEDKGEDRFEGTCMFRPPVMVSALFLIEHAYAHFLHEGLTWRMVLDWMMFSKKHQKEINWYALDALIEDFGFKRFYESFVKLGNYLLGEASQEELTKLDNKMLADVWADLDLHEFHGVKGKIALAGNEIRAAWKYHYFSPDMMITDLFRRVKAFLFERHPKI